MTRICSDRQLTTRRGARPQPTAKGFSLLEIIVAMTVLSVSLMGLAQLLAVALQQNDFARYDAVAMELAREKIEQLEAAYGSQVGGENRDGSLRLGTHGPEVITMSMGEEQPARSYSLVWQVVDLGNQGRSVTLEVRPLGERSRETPTANPDRTVTVTRQFSP